MHRFVLFVLVFFFSLFENLKALLFDYNVLTDICVRSIHQIRVVSNILLAFFFFFLVLRYDLIEIVCTRCIQFQNCQFSPFNTNYNQMSQCFAIFFTRA